MPHEIRILSNPIPCLFANCHRNTFRPGPGCSKLTMSLVNVSLKFQMFQSKIRHYFLSKKSGKLLLIFSTKNLSVFGYKVIKHLMS